MSGAIVGVLLLTVNATSPPVCPSHQSASIL